MWGLLKKFNTHVYTQNVVGKIKSRDLSKEEKKFIYIKDYSNSNPIEEDKNIILNQETYISIHVLPVDKDTCYKKINNSINNPKYFKDTFSNKLNEKQFSNLKQIEIVATKLLKKHPVSVTAENANYIAQSAYTKGEKEVKINYNIDQNGVTITKCIMSNVTKITANTRHLSIVEVRAKPAYDLNTIILETPLFNRYKLTNTFDIEIISNVNDKLLINNIMDNYNVTDSKKLGEEFRKEFSNQKFINANDEFSSIDQPLNQISEGNIIKNRYNKPKDYGLLEDLCNDILKN